MAGSNTGNPLFEPDERPPLRTSLSLALQGALLALPPVIVLPLVMVQAAGGTAALASWVVFMSLLATGAATALQTARLWMVGSGCHVAAVPSGVAIPFCALALMEGGPKALSALVLVSGLVSLAVAMRLSLLRRVFTPTVIGTVNILLAITIITVLMEKMGDLPGGELSAGGVFSAAIALLTTLAFVLRGPGVWRIWGPVVGLALGTAAAVGFADSGSGASAPRPVGRDSG